MALLIDTHVFVWIATGDPRLSSRAIDSVMDPDRQVFLSVVSRWEVVLKQQRHPEFRLPQGFDKLMQASGFATLDLSFDVPGRLESLPPIHDDPFDRLLIAHAVHEQLTFVTADRNIRRYPVPTLW